MHDVAPRGDRRIARRRQVVHRELQVVGHLLRGRLSLARLVVDDANAAGDAVDAVDLTADDVGPDGDLEFVLRREHVGMRLALRLPPAIQHLEVGPPGFFDLRPEAGDVVGPQLLCQRA